MFLIFSQKCANILNNDGYENGSDDVRMLNSSNGTRMLIMLYKNHTS